MRVIYKFTILTNKRYYIGQYSGKIFHNYWGSGKMWSRYLLGLKRKYPKHWKKLVKREILYKGNCNQTTLDKLEEIYIRKEKALYSENLGGCNILPGTANKFGSGSPMKDPEVARRVTEQLRGRKGAKRTEEGKRNISIGEKRSWINADDRRKIVAEKVSYYMQHGGAEKLSKERKGRKFSEETKRKISENHADFRGDKHPLYGSRFIWITNGIENKRFKGGELEIPIGWRKGKIDNRNKK